MMSLFWTLANRNGFQKGIAIPGGGGKNQNDLVLERKLKLGRTIDEEEDGELHSVKRENTHRGNQKRNGLSHFQKVQRRKKLLAPIE